MMVEDARDTADSHAAERNHTAIAQGIDVWCDPACTMMMKRMKMVIQS